MSDGSRRRPLFSIVTPVYEPPIDVLQEMIDSVREQTFTDWQLVLVDDVSPSADVRTVLRRAAAGDRRITVVERAANGRIVAASNDAVNAATGEFLVLVDHDDLLTPGALQTVADAIAAEPEADYLYSDEDKIDGQGTHYDAFHKPDWSPERLRNQMYTGHLSVMRTELVRQVGAFRPGFDGSQDHDLALRVTEQARHVVHIPEIRTTGGLCRDLPPATSTPSHMPGRRAGKLFRSTWTAPASPVGRTSVRIPGTTG